LIEELRKAGKLAKGNAGKGRPKLGGSLWTLDGKILDGRNRWRACP
jgi:hypothetical protein